jgi:glycine/D-amino acid oxidase-like deaminating enzyme
VTYKCDALIIGAGVIGTSIAFELSKRGYATLSVDQQPAAGHGSTGYSSAVVRTHYTSHQGVLMAYEAYFHWRDWEQHLGVVDDAGMAKLVESGIVLVKSATGHWRKSLAHYRELGVPYEEWDAAELARRCPIYDTGSFYPPRRPEDPAFGRRAGELEGAVFTPRGGFVNDAQLATHNLQCAAEAHGARFRFRSEVSEVRRRAGHVAGVTLIDGEQIDAPIVVNAAGPHSHRVNRMAGVDGDMAVRTRPLRQEVHHVPAPLEFDYGNDGITTSDGDTGVYFRPDGERHILVGSEDPPCDEREWISDPDAYPRGLTEDRWQAQVYRLALRIPTLPIPHDRKGIVSLYDVSDDWMPIYDASSLPGFYMAIGTSGNQFKMAPVAGFLMAELIDSVEHGHDHDADPVKVRGEYTDLELDAGFYSRNRRVARSSSFSVVG